MEATDKQREYGRRATANHRNGGVDGEEGATQNESVRKTRSE